MNLRFYFSTYRIFIWRLEIINIYIMTNLRCIYEVPKSSLYQLASPPLDWVKWSNDGASKNSDQASCGDLVIANICSRLQVILDFFFFLRKNIRNFSSFRLKSSFIKNNSHVYMKGDEYCIAYIRRFAK